MITRIEALRFRCLRHVAESVGRCEVVAGPNGSGKSTFLDVPLFVRDLLHVGPAVAIAGDPRIGVPRRAVDPADMGWVRDSQRLELAIELAIPREVAGGSRDLVFPRARYEVAIDLGGRGQEPGLAGEALWLAPAWQAEEMEPEPGDQLDFFSELEPWVPPRSIFRGATGRTPAGWRKIIGKAGPTGNDSYRSETSDWSYHFRLGPSRAALAILPEDETRFPIAAWVKRTIMGRIHAVRLDLSVMRLPAPPSAPRTFAADGSNLPWVADVLARCHPQRMQRWLDRVRRALPEVSAIESVERELDRSRHLVIVHAGGLRVPSWGMSDGTLRVLAYTMMPELPDLDGVLVVDNPDANLDETSAKVVHGALREIPGAQVLCSTCSHALARSVPDDGVIWFARDRFGATVTTRNPAPDPVA